MLTVLIADNSAVTLSLEKKLLAQSSILKFEAEAKNYKEVNEILAEKKIDCLIADYKIFSENNISNSMEAIFNDCKKLNLPTILFVPAEYANKKVSDYIYTFEKPIFTLIKEDELNFLCKNLETFIKETKQRNLFKIAVQKNKVPADSNLKLGKVEAVFIGVSTGGPNALLEILKNLDADFKTPIFITQHVDENFDRQLIEWLDSNVSLKVKLAENREFPKAGTVYFAPSGFHLVVQSIDGTMPYILLKDSEPVNFLCPSIDVMFESAARVYKNHCVGILLTGMGTDGAVGCCKIKENGGYTITEAEETCAVYGMPLAAKELNGSSQELPLPQIAPRIQELIEETQCL